MGRLIVGFTFNIGICILVGAKLWAITNDLKLAWSKDSQKLF